MRVIFSNGAIADLRRLRSFLQRENPVAAREALNLIIEAAAALETFPDRGSPITRTDARLLAVRFGRGAYLIDYRVHRETSRVVIVRIRHSLERR